MRENFEIRQPSERPSAEAPEESMDAHVESGAKLREAEEKERRELESVRSEFRAARPSEHGHIREDLYGDFATEKKVDGMIRLEGEAKQDAEVAAARFRKEAKYMTSTVSGEPIAAEYDIRTNNFSTQTRIVDLPDGRKAFAIYDHKGSWLHRGIDTFMKRASGAKMRKATRKEWKSWVEEKSTIPPIENDDPDTVLLPYLPNANAYDVIANNKKIDDFGACAWAKELDRDGKLDLAGSVVDEMKRLHGGGVAWGELILPNVIFTEDKKPVVCDAEIRYDGDVAFVEEKARDLKDLCHSVSGALAESEGEEDPTATVHALLDRYGDRETVIELVSLVFKKRTLLQKLTLGYELARTGTRKSKRYDAVLAAIRSYDTDRLRK